jgi:hypothetical protein
VRGNERRRLEGKLRLQRARHGESAMPSRRRLSMKAPKRFCVILWKTRDGQSPTKLGTKTVFLRLDVRKPDDWTMLIEVRAVIPIMLAQGSGSVINISSIFRRCWPTRWAWVSSRKGRGQSADQERRGYLCSARYSSQRHRAGVYGATIWMIRVLPHPKMLPDLLTLPHVAGRSEAHFARPT